MTPLHLERIARALLACGFAAAALAAVALAIPLADTSTTTASTLRERARTARALRAEALADERFDTIVAEISAGIGYGTPTELAPLLDQIQLARSFERTSGRTADTDRAISKCLARADEILAARDVGTPRVGAEPGTPAALAAFLSSLAALGAVGLGLGCAVRAGHLRHVERVAIAERLDLPTSHVDDGRFVDQVRLFALGLVRESRTRRVEIHETLVETTAALHAEVTEAAPPSGPPRPDPPERLAPSPSPYVARRRPLTHSTAPED